MLVGNLVLLAPVKVGWWQPGVGIQAFSSDSIVKFNILIQMILNKVGSNTISYDLRELVKKSAHYIFPGVA